MMKLLTLLVGLLVALPVFAQQPAPGDIQAAEQQWRAMKATIDAAIQQDSDAAVAKIKAARTKTAEMPGFTP